jgi:dolichyl-phosphate-mannose-protein mannosyltransferase
LRTATLDPVRNETSSRGPVVRFRFLHSAVLVPLLVVSLAAGIRLWQLSSPAQTIWDEGYYAFDASAYIGGGIDATMAPKAPDANPNERSWMHPPLGKWLIALGIGPLGMSSLGSRLPAAVFGTLGVLLLYLLGLELWGSPWWAGMAALLLALDGLHIVQSRIAMLDVFVTTFLTGGILFLVRDRKRLAGRVPREGTHSEGKLASLFGSRERFWAGAMFGCAVATKWIALLPLLIAAVATRLWIARIGDRKTPTTQPLTVYSSYVALPVAIYLGSYLQWFVAHRFSLVAFFHLQRDMGIYNLTNVNAHAYGASSAIGWPLLLHPIQYYSSAVSQASRAGPSSTLGIIEALGNPVFWWGFILVLPVVVWLAVARKSWSARLGLAMYGAIYLPWFLFSRVHYIYYMTAALPFMALCVVEALRSLKDSAFRWAGSAFVAAMGAIAVMFMPVWLGLRVSGAWLRLLRWLPGWP